MRNVALVASVVLLAGTRNTNADLDLAHGLLAWWDLDSRPAGRPAEFQDLSGHQRHSRRLASNSLAVQVDVNVMKPDTDLASGCGGPLHFRGNAVDDQLVVTRSAGAAGIVLGSSFSAALWVHPTRDPEATAAEQHWRTLLDNGVSGKFNPTFGVRLLGGTLAADFRDNDHAVAHNWPGEGGNKPSDMASSDAVVPDGEWSHVLVVYDGGGTGDATIYINGRVAHHERLVGAPKCNRAAGWTATCGIIDVGASPGDLWIGREAPSRRGANARAFRGFLDDIRIYNRALSPTHARGLYERCRPSP